MSFDFLFFCLNDGRCFSQTVFHLFILSIFRFCKKFLFFRQSDYARASCSSSNVPPSEPPQPPPATLSSSSLESSPVLVHLCKRLRRLFRIEFNVFRFCHFKQFFLQGCYKKVLFDLQSFFGKCHLAYRFYVHGADRHIALGEAASVIQSVFQGHAEIDKAISGIE